jgi:hypothetical protein
VLVQLRSCFVDAASRSRRPTLSVRSVILAGKRSLIDTGANTHGSLVSGRCDGGLLGLRQIRLVFFDLFALVCALVDDRL